MEAIDKVVQEIDKLQKQVDDPKNQANGEKWNKLDTQLKAKIASL